MMIVSVRCAFFTAGSGKAFTPLLTASTPVSAVHPLEKTFRSSQTARTRSKVVARHGVGAATSWIRRDRLTIGKIDDQEQRNDRGGDGDDVMQAKQAERNQQSQSRFRAVCRGAERIQAEDGDA